MELGEALPVGGPQFQDQSIFDTDLVEIEVDAEGTRVVGDFGGRPEQLNLSGRKVAHIDAVIGAQLEVEAEQVLVEVHATVHVEGIKLDQLLAGGGGDAKADVPGKIRHLLAIFAEDLAADSAVA